MFFTRARGDPEWLCKPKVIDFSMHFSNREWANLVQKYDEYLNTHSNLLWDAFGHRFWTSGEPIWTILKASWVIFDPSGGHLGLSWSHLGGPLGVCWSTLGAHFAHLEGIWRPVRSIEQFLTHFWSIFDRFLLHLGVPGGHFLTNLQHFGSVLACGGFEPSSIEFTCWGLLEFAGNYYWSYDFLAFT